MIGLYFGISGVLLVVTIGLILGIYFLMKSIDYTDSDTSNKCAKNHASSTVGAKCGGWDGKQCRRGTVKSDGSCHAKGRVLPLILLILACLSLLACIIMFILGFALHKKTAAARRRSRR